MTPVQVAAAWAHAEHSWPWAVGMRVLNLRTLPPNVNDPEFNESVRRLYAETSPSDLDPEDLLADLDLLVRAFPKRDDDLLYEEGEEWRVVASGTLPEGLLYFTIERVSDRARVDFARMGRDYFYGQIKSDGVEQWFVGSTGPMPVPDLGDARTVELMRQPVG